MLFSAVLRFLRNGSRLLHSFGSFCFMMIRIFILVVLGLLGATVLVVPGQIDRTSENVLAVVLEVEQLRYEVNISQGSSVLHVMSVAQEQGFSFRGRDFSGIGFFVEEIQGKRQNPGDRTYWIYYVNGEKAQVGVSSYIVEDKDVITFTYEEME